MMVKCVFFSNLYDKTGSMLRKKNKLTQWTLLSARFFQGNSFFISMLKDSHSNAREISKVIYFNKKFFGSENKFI